jgi:hypothetical protein
MRTSESRRGRNSSICDDIVLKRRSAMMISGGAK